MATESSARGVLLALAVLVAPALVPRSAAGTPECPPPRPVPEGIAWIGQNATLFALMTQGVVGYEGDMPDARPLPRRSLRQLAESLEASLRGHQLDGKPVHPDALYFTFYAGAAPRDEPEAIMISKRDFACITRHHDTVLLSDGVNHHTTRVFSVDRRAEAVHVLDPWPDRFFMLEGRNVRGYTAELIDFKDPLLQPFVEALLMEEGGLQDDYTRQLVKIDNAQYLKVVSGLVTLDTPEFIDYFFTVNPAAREDARTRLAFGVTLLHWGTNRFVDGAAAHIGKALELAGANGNQAVESTAANRLDLALSLQHYLARERGDDAVAQATLARKEALLARYGQSALVEGNRAIDDYRLGLAAAHAGDLEGAIRLLTRAVEKSPDYQVAYLHRAVARAKTGDTSGVVEDASRALELNALERKELSAKRARRHPRDRMGQLRDDGQEHYLNEWELTALRVRGANLQELRQFDRALVDGLRLVELEPDDAGGYLIAGFSLLGLGRTAEARAQLERAGARETESGLLGVIVDTLNQLGPPSQQDLFKQYRQAMIDRDREAAQSLVDAYPGTARVVASQLARQGQSALRAFDLPGALGAFRISLNLLEQMGDERSVALVSNDMAVTYLLMDQSHPALAAARRAKQIFRRHGMTQAEGASDDTLRRLFGRFGTTAEVEAFLEEHLVFAREHGLAEELEATAAQLKELRGN